MNTVLVWMPSKSNKEGYIMHETEWAASRPHVSSECNCHDEACRRLKHHISECPACAEKVAAETALREVLHCCACDAPKSLRDKIRGELSSRNE